jgi:prepilin signal peptidase PulO-like enzyme (type II secretory pathway)/uncharacterized protein YneF (UPF0154 family)
MIDLLIISFLFALAGMAIGFALFQFAKKQIQVRIEQMPQLAEDYIPDLLNKKYALLIWELAFAISFFLSYLVLNENIVSLVFFLIMSCCCIGLSGVDLAIRRIPNEYLLVMLVAGIANVIANPLINQSGDLKQRIVFSVLGVVISFVVFALPKKIGLYMGNGDIKLSAVIGLALGVLGYVQAMVVMALITIVLLIVLKLTKKGGWKTQAPMGPMLSAGTLITILFPLMNSIFVL